MLRTLEYIEKYNPIVKKIKNSFPSELEDFFEWLFETHDEYMIYRFNEKGYKIEKKEK